MQTEQVSKSARVRDLLQSGANAATIAKQVGCTLGLVYNVKSRMASSPKRGPGRPRKASTPAVDGLGAFLDSVRRGEQERQRLHETLVRIAAIIEQVL